MNVIQPFEKRIKHEALIRALLIGLLVACCVELVAVGIAATIFIVSKSAINLLLVISLIGILVALLSGVGAAIPTFIISKRKKLKELGHRLDSLGLDERVTTMAEYRHDNSYVAHIQREDTKERLSKIKPTALRLKVSKRLIMTIAFVLIFAILLPIVVSAIPFETDQTQTETFVDEVVNDLKDIIDDSELSEEEKEEQKEEVDDFKERLDEILNNEDLTVEEKQEQIYEEIRKEDDKLENKIESDKEILEEIKKEPIFEDLADALDRNDKDELNGIFENIEDIIRDPNLSNEDKEEILEDMKEAIDNAIQDKEDTALKDAFEDFKESLDKIQENLDSPNFEDVVEEEFEKTEDNFKDAIESGKVDQEKADRLDQAQEDLVGEENKNIDDALDNIRDTIEDSNLSQEEKDELNKEIDDLENKLDQIEKDPTLSEEEKTDKKEEAIENTQDKIEDKLEASNDYRDTIADNIDKWLDSEWVDPSDEVKENMKDLADAIEKGDKEAIEDALDKIGEDLKNSTDQIEDAGDIGEILDKITDNLLGDKEPIKEAIKDFASDMKDISNKAETDASQEEINNDIDNAINDAKENFGEALDREESLDKIDGTFDDLRQDLVGNTDKVVDDMLEDLRDVINNSGLSPTDKEHLHDKVDDLEQSVKEPGKSDWEIGAEISDTRDEIRDFIESSKGENDNLGENLENTDRPVDKEAFDQLGEAIKNNDKQGVVDALDKIKDSYQNHEGEVLDQILNQTGQAIKDAIAGEDGKLSEELGDLADSLIQAGDKAQEDSEGAKNDANNAIEDAKESIGEILDQSANKGPTGEWMDEILQQGQNSILGGQEYEKPEKPEGESQEGNKNENSEQESNKGEGESDTTKPPENTDDSTGGGGSGSISMGDEEIFIPGLGMLKLQDISVEVFRSEYDKMFQKELTPEQYVAIDAYFSSLEAMAGNNK